MINYIPLPLPLHALILTPVNLQASVVYVILCYAGLKYNRTWAHVLTMDGKAKNQWEGIICNGLACTSKVTSKQQVYHFWILFNVILYHWLESVVTRSFVFDTSYTRPYYYFILFIIPFVHHYCWSRFNLSLPSNSVKSNNFLWWIHNYMIWYSKDLNPLGLIFVISHSCLYTCSYISILAWTDRL